MAPNIKKLKVFSNHKDGMGGPDYIQANIDEVAADLETGSFLTEDQRNNHKGVEAGATKGAGGENPYLDEYRA